MTALFICGPARSGKDTVCDCLKAAGWDVASTSWWYLQHFVQGSHGMTRDAFAREHGDCWRIVLAGMIRQWNYADGAKLYRSMVEDGVQAINGVRRLAELKACVDAGLVREIWWIDAAARLYRDCVPPDATMDFDGFALEALGVPYRVIDSNGTVGELIENVKRALRPTSVTELATRHGIDVDQCSGTDIDTLTGKRICNE